MAEVRFGTVVWVMAMTLAALPAQAGKRDAQKEIAAFNQQYTSATLHMNNAEVMALWAEDGTTLLPGAEPIQGKAKIAEWLDGVTARMPGWRVTKQENQFHDIAISGDWASEWGTTVQVAQPPDGKPAMEIHGKVLLVLHREKGAWKIEKEMWNASPKG